MQWRIQKYSMEVIIYSSPLCIDPSLIVTILSQQYDEQACCRAQRHIHRACSIDTEPCRRPIELDEFLRVGHHHQQMEQLGRWRRWIDLFECIQEENKPFKDDKE